VVLDNTEELLDVEEGDDGLSCETGEYLGEETSVFSGGKLGISLC
jgi:hypothetical protein